MISLLKRTIGTLTLISGVCLTSMLLSPFYTATAADDSASAGNPALQPFPQTVTSFGAAILDGNLYTYGGHTGGSHSYSNGEQDRILRRLNFKTGKWSVLEDGPPLQGLALVAHGNRLYRIGGFTARNKSDEDHDLWSSSEVTAFDLNDKSWHELPPLPEPRSSFDAAVLGDTIYVVGGWTMAGDADSKWSSTAWKLDLSAATPAWKSVTAPPIQRRALAVAAHGGKLYAIGGMKMRGGPTRSTDVYDPATGKWSTGPEIVGDDGFTGFGASAFATGGNLYVSTIKGSLQRLSEDGSKWEVIAETPTPRFFHRMLPFDDDHLLVVGGASMESGKFDEVEIIAVDEGATSTP
jgi:Kelch motif